MGVYGAQRQRRTEEFKELIKTFFGTFSLAFWKVLSFKSKNKLFSLHVN